MTQNEDMRLRARMMTLAQRVSDDLQETLFDDPAELEKIAIEAQELDSLVKTFLIRAHDYRLAPYAGKDAQKSTIMKLADNSNLSSAKVVDDERIINANLRRDSEMQRRSRTA